VVAGGEDIRVFAFALMDTRFHLVLRHGRTMLTHFMRRLLTGYSVSCNRRHQRR
jgi:hypothetical protein